MKQCLRTLVLLIRRTVFTVKRRASTPFFDLHGHVRVQILTHEPMSVCTFEHNFLLLRLMRRVSTSCINCETVTMCNFSLKDAFLHYFDLRGRVRVQIFSSEDVSVYNFSHNFLCLRSTVMFPRSVSTTRRVHARVHALKDECLLTF